MVERDEIEDMYEDLINASSYDFSKQGKAPRGKGVYIIFDDNAYEVLHVGKTEAEGGIHERLQEYVHGNPPPPFTRYYLRGKGERLLRERYKFKCIVENNEEIRAHLEVYATVKLLRSGELLPY